jgi:PHD/YefM family antitoxin component YafN of YafNO toxin-antitoxin module
MLSATTSEIASDYAAWQARALGQPVDVLQEGRPSAVMLSADEYRRLKRRDR